MNEAEATIEIQAEIIVRLRREKMVLEQQREALQQQLAMATSPSTDTPPSPPQSPPAS